MMQGWTDIGPLSFGLLIAISFAVIVIVLYKERGRLLLPWFLFLISLAYLFEMVILLMYESYWYKPGILDDPYFDHLLGALSSQGLAVPAAALVFVAYRLRFIWAVLISAGFVGIEVLFLQLGIYGHDWWRLEYTFGGVVLYFWIGRMWYDWMIDHATIRIRTFTLYGCALAILASTAFVQAGVAKQIYYNVPWFHEPMRSSATFSSLLVLLYALIFTIIEVQQTSLMSKMTVWLFLVGIEMLLHTYGILVALSPYAVPIRIAELGLLLFVVMPMINNALDQHRSSSWQWT